MCTIYCHLLLRNNIANNLNVEWIVSYGACAWWLPPPLTPAGQLSVLTSFSARLRMYKVKHSRWRYAVRWFAIWEYTRRRKKTKKHLFMFTAVVSQKLCINWVFLYFGDDNNSHLAGFLLNVCAAMFVLFYMWGLDITHFWGLNMLRSEPGPSMRTL